MMSTLPDILARSYPSDEMEVYDWDGRYLYTLTVNLDTMLSEIYRYDLP